VNSRQKKGIRIKDLTIGIGRGAEPGTVAVIKYQGFLNRGDRVASSDDQPGGEYRFEVGRRDPTAMLESSVIGMREGGTREARVSPHLAYREGTPDQDPSQRGDTMGDRTGSGGGWAGKNVISFTLVTNLSRIISAAQQFTLRDRRHSSGQQS
jgi:hypothetical protein